MKPPRPTPSECPVCGADVPPRARACPACGADERTGWDEDGTRYDGLDLPEEAFDEPDDGRKKSSRRPQTRINGLPVFWWALGAVLLGLILYASLSPILRLF